MERAEGGLNLDAGNWLGFQVSSTGTHVAGFAVAVGSPVDRPGLAPITASLPTTTSRGFLVDATRIVAARGRAARWSYALEGLGVLDVDMDAQVAAVDPAMDPAAAREILFGPGLLLLLATRGIYGIHSSAIRAGGRCFVLPALSGSGKSTFARLAAEAGAEALTDDISPLLMQDGVLRLRPRYPQLKWEDPWRTPDLDLPVSAIVFLQRDGSALALEPLGAAEATRLLIRDTVAARLFPPHLLRTHLEAMACFAESVPCWRLHWPEAAPDALADQCARALSLFAPV